jgi:hypothetical protein
MSRLSIKTTTWVPRRRLLSPMWCLNHTLSLLPMERPSANFPGDVFIGLGSHSGICAKWIHYWRRF